MKHLGIASFIASVAMAVFGCSTSVSPGDSETHWIACKTDADCHGGKTCQEERCVAPDARDSRASITNPTGTCVAPDSGERRGYQSPEAGDVWLPDCKNPLKREYYRVFVRSDASAYVMPRPEAINQLDPPCEDASHPMHALVEKYSLCEYASDEATVERINHMTPSDALTLTHYIHTQLIFDAIPVIGSNMVVRPYPMAIDAIDACALHPEELSPALAADCDAERAAIDSGPEGPTFYATAPELARLLNELYGVAGCVYPDYAGTVCTECGASGGCGKIEVRCTRACRTSADCAGVQAGETCSHSVCSSVLPCF